MRVFHQAARTCAVGGRIIGVNALGYRLGAAGAILGVVAGMVQWAFGKDIPDWTGNKLHPVQLGIITIVLSLVALASVGYLTRHPGPLTWQRALAGLGVLGPAGVCFTTVGALWYLPGALLIVSALLLLRPRPAAAAGR
jgi:hypothetical protein